MQKWMLKLLNKAMRDRAKSDEMIAQTDAQEIVRAAAQSLGRTPKDLIKGRRKHKRKWTGFVQDQRCWVGRKVILAGGVIAMIEAVKNRMLIVSYVDENNHFRRHYCAPSSVNLWKSPEAQLLGKLKRGKKERRSVAKGESSRRNGCCPPKPGSRPRGRPKKSTSLDPSLIKESISDALVKWITKEGLRASPPLARSLQTDT